MRRWKESQSERKQERKSERERQREGKTERQLEAPVPSGRGGTSPVALTCAWIRSASVREGRAVNSLASAWTGGPGESVSHTCPCSSTACDRVSSRVRVLGDLGPSQGSTVTQRSCS